MALVFLPALPARSEAGDFPEPDNPDLGANVFFLDGLAVDTLKPEPEPEIEPRFRAGMPTLSEGSPGMRRRRLMDEPEPLRDPAERREVAVRMERAQQLAQRNRWEAALLELRDALALDPVNPAVLSRAAAYATQALDFERAAGFFRRLVEIHPDEPELKAGYGAVLLRLARFDEAERLLGSAAQSIPDDLTVRFFQLGLDLLRGEREQPRAYWKTRTIEQMVQLVSWLDADRDIWKRLIGANDFESLCELTLGPGTYPKLDALAAEFARLQPLLQTQQGQAMLSSLESLRALGADSLGIDAAKAEALFLDGQTDASLAIWQRLLRQNPEWLDARFNYAFTLLRADRYAEAVSAFRDAREYGDPPILQFLLAVALSLDGEHDKPRDLFTKLVLSNPQHVRSWLESDDRFYRALHRMDNAPNLLRRLGIPPELE